MEYDFIKDVWPEWQIVKELGEGSFGKVYEALRSDHSLETRCAIKVISIPRNSSELDSIRMEGLSLEDSITYLHGVVDDCVNEIQLMESFKGTQNIVSVEDYKVVEKKGTVGWDIYIRMELLTSFNKYATENALPESEVIRLGVDICKALELCAKRNVIHRDIKPENIFINSFGDFKLGDFGIARKLESLTEGMSQKGTYNYMAPEIERGETYDATVDLYSLGIVLYKLLNKNRMPFLDTEKQILNPSERREALLKRLSGEPLPPPRDASDAMAKVILRACEPDPKNRYQTATEMKQALLSISGETETATSDKESISLDQEDVLPATEKTTPPVPETTTAPPNISIKPASIVIAALAVFLILGVIIWYVNGQNTKNGKNRLDQSAEITDSSNSVKSTDLNDPDPQNPYVPTEEETEYVKGILKTVETYEQGENYLNALESLTTANKKYPHNEELIAKLEAAKKDVKYAMVQKNLVDIQQMVEEADGLFLEKGHQSALDYLSNAQKRFPDSLLLQSKVEEITAYVPVDPFSLSVLDISENDELSQGLYYVASGEQKNDAVAFCHKTKDMDKGYVVLQLEGRFDKLEGILRQIRVNSSSPYDYEITLFNDDMDMIGSILASKTVYDTPFSFDVTGITNLTITFERIYANRNSVSAMMDYHTYNFVLYDFKVYKSLPVKP